VGKAAPKTEMPDVLSQPFNLANLRGKVVLFYFYTGTVTMYPKVRAHLEPHMARLKDRPVVLVLVNATTPATLAARVKADPGAPIVLVTGGGKKASGVNTPLYQDWGVYV